MTESKLNKQRLQELEEAFSLFDSNQSGSISAQELGKVLERLQQDPAQAAALIRQADINLDGTIQWPEFVTFMESLEGGDVDAEMQAAFRVYDMNGDGFIGPDELRQVMHDVNHVDVEEALLTQLIASADTNCDGLIDYGEFVGMLKRKGVV